jgi:signal transduction histidine kinase/AraC-like DNA-binding protein
MDHDQNDKLFDDKELTDDNEQLFSDSAPEGVEKEIVKPEFSDPAWKVMVVDDEEDIHSVTRIALKSFSYRDRGIEFIHSHSAEESKPLLRANPDIALILLDVVMETNTAGLDLVKFIRDDVHLKYTQIILRTGHPGYAPEREVIVSYEINDYKTKTELTAFKLFTLVLASLRAYDSVTELERMRLGLEDKIKERTAELEQKNLQIMEMDQMKTRFFSNVSHEFRTPLTLIIGPLEDILSKEELTEKNRVTMERMHRNAVRLLGLINQLLDLSKLDAGSMRLELSESDILRFSRLIISSFQPLADRKNIHYEVSIPAKEYITYFDHDKLEKILTNLLSNAFKYTPDEGEIECQIKIASRGKNNDLDFMNIRISDSGPGIPLEMVDKIFDRFYQVEGSWQHSSGGTGIGLSLTRELVGLQHGQIKVESAEGKGSTFTIIFPLGKEHLDKHEFQIGEKEDLEDAGIANAVLVSGSYENRQTEDGGMEEQNGKAKILVVEDSEDVRAHLLDNLEDQFTMLEAVDGEEGLSLATETIPDIIITDLMMPKMDGVELCKRLKSDERTSHIPVIMLTAKATVESRIEGLETGADAYMTKPFNMQELQTRLKSLIEQRKKLRERFSKETDLGPSDIAVTSVDEKFLNKAIQIIEQNLGDCDFDVTAMTGEIGMSRMQLFRKLKALTNQTPSEFIRTIRLKRAAQLLKKNFGNVAEITYEVGFNNLSYFAKCFRELYGVSPSEYAKA